MIPQRIVRQYTQYCEETGFKPFSQSTMLRVLSQCSASVRKSLQGLDYYAADGTRAFDDLISLVRKINEVESDMNWERRMIESLKAAKLYLKGDYKVHLEKEASIPDHCVAFSLSDASDPDYQVQCQHNHEDICEQFEALNETLREIDSRINCCHFSSDDEREEAIYIMQSSKLAIRSWQCHILRSFNQDQARLDFLDLLDNETVLIVNDWAMKFLPQRYRESQSDWFGKRGISWHISVVYRRSDSQLQWQGYVHIIQSCSQDSTSVISIMHDVLRSIKSEYPNVTKAYFRQDNAGCYHSSATILACPVVSSSTGVQIRRIDFSDPQGGKGAADRLVATCKAHVRIFINEGHDVTNATQLKDALVSHGGIDGVRVACLDAVTTASPISEPAKIHHVSKLNNFEFTEGDIKAWRAYDIGRGKEIKADTSTTESENRWLESTFSPGKFKSFGHKEKKHVDHDESPKTRERSSDVQESQTNHGLYTCPESGCTRVFQRHSALTKHLSSEKCIRSLEKHTLMDLAKLGYQQVLEEGVGVVPTLRTTSVANKQSRERLTEGWALRPAKKAYRFSEKQKAYLTAKFNIGQSTGRKVDASLVARDMRRAHGSNGERLFKSTEFLTSQQISSYFSRLSATTRQQTLTHEADLTAIEDEINFSTARDQVMATVTLQHPIVFDQYNICAMAEEDTLKSLKVSLLQVICQGLNLDIPDQPIRRKAP